MKVVEMRDEALRGSMNVQSVFAVFMVMGVVVSAAGQVEDGAGVYFHDDFGGCELIAIVGDDAISGSGWSGNATELRSPAINLAGAPGADLAVLVGHTGVEIGKSLAVEYLACDGVWRTAARIRSDGLDGGPMERITRTLPTEALHAEGRVRFVVADGDPDDEWRIGEVTIREFEPLRRLSVELDPPRRGITKAALGGRLDGMDIAAPFTRRFPSGSTIYLVAPPSSGNNLFSHWTVSNGYETYERAMQLEMTDHLEVVAHYTGWTPGRSEASALILSRPLAGAPLKMGVEPGEYFISLDAEVEYAGLTGEQLWLLAPERTDRMVFSRWVVDGTPNDEGERLLEHRLGDRDVLVAEYALLGDINGDDAVDKHDVELFIAALIDPDGYAQTYPDLDREQRGDVNGDGVFDALDLEAFVDLLTKE